MKIDVFSTMRNEERILPYFLRHYEQIADRIFVWEDSSTDRTREILQSHPKVRLMPLEETGILDLYWIGTLWQTYKTLSRNFADWVIVADADEFIYHPDLKKALSESRYAIKCQGHCMFAEEFPTTSGQIYDEIKTGVPDELYDKTTVFQPEIDIKWRRGRHGRPRIRLNEMEIPKTEDSGIKLLHYRFLGMEYGLGRYDKNRERAGYREHKYMMPDGKRANPAEWWEQHSDEVRVII